MLSPKRLLLLDLLADGQCHSGEALAENLSMSRAAVAKHVTALRELGLGIQSTTGVGYQLQRPLDFLSPKRLEKELAHTTYFPVIDSTNTYLKSQLPDVPQGYVCFAEAQTQGRGRRGRVWQSPLGGQLMFSLHWKLAGGMMAAMGLSLVVGVSIVQTLETLGVSGLQLKWPNDILAQGKKLAGILVELAGSPSDCCDAIIGVGLNTTLSQDQGQTISQPWIDIARLAQNKIPKTTLAIAIIHGLRRDLQRYNRFGFAEFQTTWQEYDAFYQKPVTLIQGGIHTQGIVQGVNAQGALVIETHEGLQDIYSGDVSLRGR